MVRTLVIPKKRPDKFADLLKKSDMFNAVAQWINARAGTAVTYMRDETDSFWICKIVYRGAFIMVPDDLLMEAVKEATARVEKVSDGH